MRRKHPMIRKLLLDAAAAGLALMVFALFHHVLPRAQQSLNVQTIRPVQAEETAVPETEEAEGFDISIEVDALGVGEGNCEPPLP